MDDRRSAVAGERFTFQKRYAIRGSAGELEVKPKAEGDRGQWVCISCGVPLQNNFDKDSHCSGRAPRASRIINPLGCQANHVLAWRSGNSGEIEEP